MLDKNGVEIKSGDIVEITGAFFKNDNGLYFVESSPGDPSWSGTDYCLKKISKAGKISTAKYNICFWPITAFVSDRAKTAKARRWNREHAAIEVKEPLKDMGAVAAFFQRKADNLAEEISRLTRLWGENAEGVQRMKTSQTHYEAVAHFIERKEL